MHARVLALAVVALSPLAAAQSEPPRPTGLSPAAEAVGTLRSMPRPGAEADRDGTFREASHAVTRALLEAEALGDALASVSDLLSSEPFEDSVTAQQVVSGAALNWLLRRPEAWDGHLDAVARLVEVHAANDGVMYGAMVEAVRALDGRAKPAEVDRLRKAVGAAYARREAAPCASCTDVHVFLGPDLEGLPASLRDRLKPEYEWERAALAVAAGWAGRD